MKCMACHCENEDEYWTIIGCDYINMFGRGTAAGNIVACPECGSVRIREYDLETAKKFVTSHKNRKVIAYSYDTKLERILEDYSSARHAFITRNYNRGNKGHGLNPKELVFVVESTEYVSLLRAYWKHIPDGTVFSS